MEDKSLKENINKKIHKDHTNDKQPIDKCIHKNVQETIIEQSNKGKDKKIQEDWSSNTYVHTKLGGKMSTSRDTTIQQEVKEQVIWDRLGMYLCTTS